MLKMIDNGKGLRLLPRFNLRNSLKDNVQISLLGDIHDEVWARFESLENVLRTSIYDSIDDKEPIKRSQGRGSSSIQGDAP